MAEDNIARDMALWEIEPVKLTQRGIIWLEVIRAPCDFLIFHALHAAREYFAIASRRQLYV